MAIFGKSNSVAKENNATTIIATGTEIEGSFNLSAKFHIEGKCLGNINSTNDVSIGKNGVVEGELKCKKLIVNGKFSGNIECEVVEIMQGGFVKGDVIVNNLIIENGALFEGNSKIKGTNKSNDTIKTTEKSK